MKQSRSKWSQGPDGGDEMGGEIGGEEIRRARSEAFVAWAKRTDFLAVTDRRDLTITWSGSRSRHYGHCDLPIACFGFQQQVNNKSHKISFGRD